MRAAKDDATDRAGKMTNAEILGTVIAVDLNELLAAGEVISATRLCEGEVPLPRKQVACPSAARRRA